MKSIFSLCLIILASVAFGQSTVTYNNEFINMLNAQNEKVGLWKLYDDRTHTFITIDYDKGGEVNYYKDSKLAATKKGDRLDIFQEGKATTTYYAFKSDGSQTLVDEKGNEIDAEIVKYYAQASEAIPMFYGGMPAFYAYIGDNFNKKGKAGKVYLKFMIDTNGFISDIEITNSTNADLNEEALRVLKNSPRWQPGFQGGGFVKVNYSVPLHIN